MRHSHSPVLAAIFAVLIGGGFFLIVYALFSLFTVSTLSVEGAPASVLINSDDFPRNLMFFPVDRTQKLLLEEYPQLASVTIQKYYPHELHFVLKTRDPVARAPFGTTFVSLDATGKIFAYTTNGSLPLLSFPIGTVSLGSVANGRGVAASLAFLSVVSHDEHIEEIVLNDPTTLEVRMDGTRVFLDPNRDGKESANTLQVLVKGFRMKGSLPRLIDLRFTKPVITQ